MWVVVTGIVARMIAFLSPDWLAALDAAAQADPALAAATQGVTLVVEQHISDAPSGDVCFHVTFDNGRVRVTPGPATATSVSFSQDYATAMAIANGSESAQRAFMTGKLRVGGDLRALLDHQVAMAALNDVFSSVRDQTDMGVGHA